MAAFRRAMMTSGVVFVIFIGSAGFLKSEETLPSLENSLGMQLILIPAGEFRMGSSLENVEAIRTAESHPSAKVLDDEQPQHLVKITKPFYLGQTEVTQQQWTRVMKSEPWKRGFVFKGNQWVKEGENYPAMFVSWENAQEFCQKLTEQEHANGTLAEDQKYRLPTEAEWEYACRAGSTTNFSFGDDPSALDDYGWWGGVLNGNARDEKYAHAVATKLANPWGLHDMHGNVFEWCEDRYDKTEYKSREEVTIDPIGNGTDLRVLRGGSWIGQSWITRSAMRSGGKPRGTVSTGLRVARTP